MDALSTRDKARDHPMCPRRGLLGNAILALAAAAVVTTNPNTKTQTPTLTYLPGTLTTIVNSSSAGATDNKHGFEDGSVVRTADNVTHMFVSELFGDPLWIRMRLGHWQTADRAGATGWHRTGTLILDGASMVSTANCSDTADHNAALWSPIMFKEGGFWHMTYVGYNCGRGYSNANTDGVIKLARSTVAGDPGVAGPFVSLNAGQPLLARRNNSQSWEGKQGIDSFSAYRPPRVSDSRKSPRKLLAFYGSSPFGWPWNVGLAESLSGSIVGPWQRLPTGTNPLPLNGGHTENPMVLQVAVPGQGEASVLLMVHDWVTGGRAGFGFTHSMDGIVWANSTIVAVPGGCEAPHGILPSLVHPGGVTVWFNKRGEYDNLYVAQFVLTFE